MKLQLTLEQHGFELHRSVHKRSFSISICQPSVFSGLMYTERAIHCTLPFCVRDLSTADFGVSGVSSNQSPVDIEGRLTYYCGSERSLKVECKFKQFCHISLPQPVNPSFLVGEFIDTNLYVI